MAEKESHEPTHKAFSVIKREGKKDYWLNIGVAFPQGQRQLQDGVP